MKVLTEVISTLNNMRQVKHLKMETLDRVMSKLSVKVYRNALNKIHKHAYK
jgi:hypothetical protein